MKTKIIIAFTIVITSCVSIPQETIKLSKAVGDDLVALHNSHRNITEIYYSKIKNDIETFIGEVYSPFIIHYVLKVELDKYKKGEPSLYGAIIKAGEIQGKDETDEALNVMVEFQEAANAQIVKKRKELLGPIIKQEKELVHKINTSYENAIYANSTITAYLESIKKVKESQKKALSMVGLQGADSTVTNTLLNISELVNEAIEKGKEIDVKSDQAYAQIEEITKKIKSLTNKE